MKDVGMGTFILALTLGILARAWLSSLIRLPYTCLVLLFGLLHGFLIYTEVSIPIKVAAGKANDE